MKNLTKERIDQIFDIIRNISEYLEHKTNELPYSINVIDELHANENAHSRILCKLLRYTDNNGKYKILEDLLQYISQLDGKEDFKKIQIGKPNITQEIGRIDLWVRDDKNKRYSIIFENKVRGAVDQSSQLARYIDTTKEAGFKSENIYVIYLPAYDSEPTEQSWGTYKEEFKGRYVNLSFKKHILPWLKESILPNCVIREELLISALKQYIDHLEGIFWLRPSQNKIIMNSGLLEKIGLNKEKSFAEQYDEFRKIFEDIQKVYSALNQIQEEELKSLVKRIENITKDYFGEDCAKKYDINEGKGWFFIYKNTWVTTKSSVHLEWQFNNLFNNSKCNLVLHLEGGWNSKNDFIDKLRKKCNNVSIKKQKKSNTTFYMRSFHADTPLAMMNEEKLHAFLEDAYKHEDIQTIIKALDELNKELSPN